jgi:hypothetical protein
MKRLLLVVALAVAGCGGGNGNDLTGSLSEVYPLDFDTVEIDQLGSTIVITYVHSPGSDIAKTAKLIVDTTNIALDQPPTMINLAEMFNGSTRGILQRVEKTTIGFPIMNGHLLLNQKPTPNATLSGSFSTTLSDPMGRTLNGDFSAAVVPLQ